MFSRFLSLSAVLSVVFCNTLFHASEILPPELLLWMTTSHDGTKGKYLQEDFKTGEQKYHEGTITKIAGSESCSHEVNGYVYKSLKPDDNSIGLIAHSRAIGDESGAEPEMVRVDRNEVINTINKANKTYYFERENHKKYELNKRLFASH